MTRRMAMEYKHGLMEKFTRVCSKMASSMGRESINLLVEVFMMVSTKMTR
jgi:hypothetical protein